MTPMLVTFEMYMRFRLVALVPSLPSQAVFADSGYKLLGVIHRLFYLNVCSFAFVEKFGWGPGRDLNPAKGSTGLYAAKLHHPGHSA